MEAIMLLCDYAEAIEGKLYVMGGGWTVHAPGPSNMSIALKVMVPWDRANEKHAITLMLQDAEGNVVSMGEPPMEVRHEGEFVVGRPPEVKKGTPLDFVLCMNFVGLVLEPEQSYRWQLEIDGVPEASASFSAAEE